MCITVPIELVVRGALPTATAAAGSASLSRYRKQAIQYIQANRGPSTYLSHRGPAFISDLPFPVKQHREAKA